MSKRKSNRVPKDPVQADITALSHEGRGIAKINDKAIFVRNALPDESVMFKYLKKHRQYDEGIVSEVLTPAENRVTPECEHFGVCGGCNLQHLSHDGQIIHKQSVLMEQLQHIGKVTPKEILPPLLGPLWGYRHKARLGAKYVRAKEKMLVGFREIDGRFLAQIDSCKVLHPAVGEKLTTLQALIRGLSIYEQVPQIEVAVAEPIKDNNEPYVGMIFRHLAPFTEQDLDKLKDFAQAENIKLYLQPGNADTVHRIWPQDGDDFLHYYIPSHTSLTDEVSDLKANLRSQGSDRRVPGTDSHVFEFKSDTSSAGTIIDMRFEASDFTQVNPHINRQMIKRTLDLLALEPGDRVLDLFCGLGNFTLPIAKNCKEVVGVEGAPSLVERAKANAEYNNINNAHFHAADLTKELTGHSWAKSKFDKILLDPPRTGALETIELLPSLKAKRIIYVSCNPATLARDAGALCEKGYTLVSAGIMDMFPHTGHVESIAVFEQGR